MAPSEQVPTVRLRGLRGRARYPAAHARAAPPVVEPPPWARGGGGGWGSGGGEGTGGGFVPGACGPRGCAHSWRTCPAGAAGQGPGQLRVEEASEVAEVFAFQFRLPRGVQLCPDMSLEKLPELSFR